MGGSGVAAGVGLGGCGGGCAGGRGWGGRRDQISLLSLFRFIRQDTDEVRLAIKYSSYNVLWCDAHIAPCGGDGQAYLVFRSMSCACVQAGDAGYYCAAGGFVEACAVGSSGTVG